MKSSFSMRLSTLLKSPPAWLTQTGECDDVIIATRVEYKRNLRDFSFPGWAEDTQRAEVFDQISKVAAETEIFQRGFCSEMKDLSLDARRLLTEWQLITPTLAARRDGCGFISSSKGNDNLLINDEEHLILCVNEKGSQPFAAVERAKKILQALSDKLSFAYDERLGFLMSSPKEAGLGFRLSFIMHLPGLTLADLMTQVVNAAQPLSYEIRPLYGEDTDAIGNLYEVSSVCRDGEDEESVVRRMQEVFITLTKRELSLRDKFFGLRFCEFLDPVERGVGILHYAIRIGWREALNHLSYIRMGNSMELVNWNAETSKRAAANLPLLMHTLSSSFLKLHPDSEMPETDDIEVVRSFRIKQLLSPALPFGIATDND